MRDSMRPRGMCSDAGDRALLELVELAHVDHEGRLGRLEACLELASVELADL